MTPNGSADDSRATPPWIAETLGLDRELLANVAGRTEEWGLALSGGAEDASVPAIIPEPTLYEAASLLTIAGSYWMLLDARRASEVFRQAARLYQRLDDRFAHPVAICAGDTDVSFSALEERDTVLSPSSRAHVMLALGWLESGSPEARGAAKQGLAAHAQAAAPAATESVGRIGLPLDATVRVLTAAEALLEEGQAAMPMLTGALHDYLVRLDDIARAARADSFHWRSLLSSVLPVEPEATAVGAIVAAAAMQHSMEDDVATSIDLSPAATIPLHMGLAVARESRGRS
jgi:hypothetical protein